MPSMTEGERREFPREIIEILDNHAAELTAAGFDPAVKQAALVVLADTADASEADQLSAKIAHDQATDASQAATKAGYEEASNIVEIVVGTMGKDHALSQNIRQLRST